MPEPVHISQPLGEILGEVFGGMDRAAEAVATSLPRPTSVLTSSATVPAPSRVLYYCPLCPEPFWSEHPCVVHAAPIPQPPSIGWECPRCQTVHAPWVVQCGCPPRVVLTWGGSSDAR